MGTAPDERPYRPTEGARMDRRRGQSATTVRWGLTMAATAVSTGALEVVAATTGVLLLASGVFDGSPRVLMLSVLAATYAAWAIGLRANVVANWCLLEQTGTSTNVLSKVGFEVARLRTSRERVVRAVSAVGYVVTEVLKEAPYCAGAFGTALLSDAVDSTDALAFLAGTNVGAAIYEYGVARLTRTYLHNRSRRTLPVIR